LGFEGMFAFCTALFGFALLLFGGAQQQKPAASTTLGAKATSFLLLPETWEVLEEDFSMPYIYITNFSAETKSLYIYTWIAPTIYPSTIYIYIWSKPMLFTINANKIIMHACYFSQEACH
jgi:hypothetical protein